MDLKKCLMDNHLMVVAITFAMVAILIMVAKQDGMDADDDPYSTNQVCKSWKQMGQTNCTTEAINPDYNFDCEITGYQEVCDEWEWE